MRTLDLDWFWLETLRLMVVQSAEEIFSSIRSFFPPSPSIVRCGSTLFLSLHHHTTYAIMDNLKNAKLKAVRLYYTVHTLLTPSFAYLP